MCIDSYTAQLIFFFFCLVMPILFNMALRKLQTEYWEDLGRPGPIYSDERGMGLMSRVNSKKLIPFLRVFRFATLLLIAFTGCWFFLDFVMKGFFPEIQIPKEICF